MYHLVLLFILGSFFFPFSGREHEGGKWLNRLVIDLMSGGGGIGNLVDFTP